MDWLRLRRANWATPLATIALVVRELEHSTKPDDPHADDIALLRDQVKRCRDILQTLTSLGSGDAPFDRMPLSILIEEVVEPHRDFGIDIVVDLPEDRDDEPVIARNPGPDFYGLGKSGGECGGLRRRAGAPHRPVGPAPAWS